MNISLIGMPGSGKSTVGKELAALMGLYFLDTDKYIEGVCRTTLQEVVEKAGSAFGQLEERLVLEATDGVEDTVIATGGSVVHSDKVIKRLRQMSIVFFIDVPEAELVRRISKEAPRGIDYRGHTSLHGLYGERRPLYQKAAHIAFSGVHTIESSAAALGAIATTFMGLEKTQYNPAG